MSATTRHTTTSRTLKDLYTVVLGTNIAFLPVLLTSVAHEHGLLLGVVLFILLFCILIRDWWLTTGFFDEYDLDKPGKWFALRQVAGNIAYLLPLLSLGVLPQALGRDFSMGHYAAALAIVSLIDSFIVASIWASHKYEPNEREKVRRYFWMDAMAFIAYLLFALVALNRCIEVPLWLSIFPFFFLWAIIEGVGNHWWVGRTP